MPKVCKIISIQLVVVTDGTYTFALFIYGQITASASPGRIISFQNMDGSRNDNRFTDSATTTYVNKQGLFMFKTSSQGEQITVKVFENIATTHTKCSSAHKKRILLSDTLIIG
jgi:hypothetical protein